MLNQAFSFLTSSCWAGIEFQLYWSCASFSPGRDFYFGVPYKYLCVCVRACVFVCVRVCLLTLNNGKVDWQALRRRWWIAEREILF